MQGHIVKSVQHEMFNKLQLGTQPATFLAKAKLNRAGALVLLKLMYHINRANMVMGTPQEISKLTGVTVGDFHLGVRSLKQLDFIWKYSQIHCSIEILISSYGHCGHFGWSGLP